MSALVFAGPTLSRAEVLELLPDAVVLGPAGFGDVYRAAAQGSGFIGLIDGYFDQRLSVWHKEVLWALSHGRRIYGAASMGALRAAELASFGMVGVGRIFELYASGELEDDDEVAVVHESEENAFRPRSEAMVNIRATMELAVTKRVVSAVAAAALLDVAKAHFYPERSYAALLHSAAKLGFSATELGGLRDWLATTGGVNQKRLDAIAMLQRMKQDIATAAPPEEPRFRFVDSDAWQAFLGRRKVSPDTEPHDDVETVTVQRSLDDRISLDRLHESAPELAAKTWLESLERALCLMLAADAGVAPDAEATRAEAQAFVQARGLTSQEKVEAWLVENDLDAGTFSALVYDEVLVRRFRETARRLGLLQVSNTLRASADYPASKARNGRDREP